MPQTVNGIGTHYYGAKNKHVREAACEHCGTYTELSSYDTTKFVVFVYIPLIPLGRLRIVDDCASCRKHYAIPLDEWRQQKDDAIASAAAALRDDPWNAAPAIELVRNCCAYHDGESLARYESSMESALSNDAEGLAFLGAAYDYFKESRKSEASYKKSLALRDDPGVRQTLGIMLVREKRPDEAKQYFAHLLSPTGGGDFAPLYYLVEGYQAQGMHADASALLDEMALAVPSLERVAQFDKYRKRVQKRLGSTRPLAFGKGFGMSTGTRVGIGILVLAAAAGGYFLFHKTQRANVYLMNGLDRPYRVTIADRTHELAPYDLKEISIPRRTELIARAAEEELGWPATVDLAMATNFWSALFEKRTYVINPDRTAVIVWEQMEYAVNPTEKELPYRVHLGRGLHTFDDVSYVFEEFPDEITLDSHQQVARRNRIFRVFEVDPAEAYAEVLERGRRKDGLEYLKARLRAYPEEETTMQLVATLIPEEFAEMARPHLEARPLRMEWHRTHQAIAQMAGRGDELERHYRGLVDAEPENADLEYLLARAMSDPASSEHRMRRAAERNPPSSYAVHGLAFQRLTVGRFEEALALSRRAQELSPEMALFAYSENEALLALGRLDVLIEENQAARAESLFDAELVTNAVRLLVAAGKSEDARAVIEDYLQELDAAGGDRELWRSYLEAVYFLGAGDWNGFLERARVLEEPRLHFQATLAAGEYQAAIEGLTSAGDASAYDHLLVYLAARRARDRRGANERLQAAIGILAEGVNEERILARCLAGETSPSVALELTLQPKTKMIALFALGLETGDAGFTRLARRLGYQLSFERYFIERLRL